MSKQHNKKSDRREAQRAAANTPRAAATPKPATPRTSSRTAAAKPANDRPLTFGRDTYIWMGIGFGLVVLSLLLMSGGRGEDPAVFDENVIYSFRKITLAPIVMLAGLGTVIYAILKK
ncbi:DUF3098 domain-containing protein [Neolewinella aurantiaca]|uniref:DUF3098 domain-containing protein n=1 Tax=Neolewinella aurantiaca TaxID=2602767 RepID=A0A5C7FNU0_9BACT|nr:DUF3098 domain-containing protein [Neolewinella aurantiaca]TXF88042.1 DUF3098 domain-containing protein [Neolewinella aurantiaca]